MASAKAKRILERLEQIKEEAAQANAAYRSDDEFDDGSRPEGLAEEAAGLGLELHAILTAKKEK